MKTNGTPRDDGAASGPNGTLGADAEWSALRYVLGEMTAAEADAFEQTLASDPQACEQVAAATHLTSTVYNVLATEEPTCNVLATEDRNNVLATELSGQAPNGVGMSMSARPAPVVVPARSVRGEQVRTEQVRSGQVRRGQVRRGQWAIVGLAAAVCVVVAGGLSWLSAPSNPQETAAGEHADGASSLVAIWTEQSAEAAEESSTRGAVAGEHANAGETASSGVAVADADDLNGTDEDEVLIADDDYNVPGWMIAAVDNNHSFSPGNPSTDVQEN
jgi:hypothetical protein